MTAFHLQQSDHARCARKKTYADTLQIHVTNCAVKLHSHFHEARKIVGNNLSSAVQAHVMELPLYAKQALPLIFIRLSRLANSSPTNRRNPAIRWRNDRESSHKNSGEMSRLLPHNFPAMAGQRQKQYRRISARATRNLARNYLAAAMSQSEQQKTQHPAKHPASRLVKVLTSPFQP